MRIMYVITRSDWGGAQAHLYELIKYQVGIGNEVLVVVGNKGGFSEKVGNIIGVNLKILSDLQRELSVSKDLKIVIKLKTILKKFKPDILHLHSSKAGTVGRIAAIGLPVKVVFTVHGWAFTDGISAAKRLIYKMIERPLNHFTDATILVSKYDYKLGIQTNVLKKNKNAIVIYNGVEIAKSIKQDKKIVNNKTILTMTARFDRQKNQELLIKALVKVESNILVRFIGDGPSLSNMKILANDLHVQDKVEFLGYRSDVNTLLKETDIFILITNWEGLPISILEAMRLGIPVIASNVGGIDEEIETGISGILVENNIDEIVNAVDGLVNNVELQNNFSRTSIETINNKFIISDMDIKTNNLYRELIKSE
ncbi:glycosyltransferase family 4 protein [Dellaglioa carnosa]|uniref:glycosyltransferase family 4 protein n=1 Tax=Dellaglioa carnosa TaxID=2995136 RepID=UPI0022A864DA|nr:glycosyltransferase family 4 protein [Dellaglioa carnosa]MCZ2492137.1 glycosyltransferase family 4 protein [Dellaglioa carnosa]